MQDNLIPVVRLIRQTPPIAKNITQIAAHSILLSSAVAEIYSSGYDLSAAVGPTSAERHPPKAQYYHVTRRRQQQRKKSNII
jgi:hypothetical protein